MYSDRPPTVVDCAFLQDNENNKPLTLQVRGTIYADEIGKLPKEKLAIDFGLPEGGSLGMRLGFYHNGRTYAFLPQGRCNVDQAEAVAQFFGGHVVSITNAELNALLATNLVDINESYSKRHVIGLTEFSVDAPYRWADGTPVSYLNWATSPVVGTACWDWAAEIFPDSGLWSCNVVGLVAPNYSTINWVILDLPGTRTEAELNAAALNGSLAAFVRGNPIGDLLRNAFLSKFWELNTATWMRFNTFSNTTAYGDIASLSGNFWGTTSANLLNYAIVDYEDTFKGPRVDFMPLRTNGFASTYPHVESVRINSQDAMLVPLLGGGATEFKVRFNRGMNTNVQPMVTFGPAFPFTDFRVRPVGNGWVDANTWIGNFTMNPMTGDGYHLMRISGAVAADDSWLVSGYDVGRLRFQVKTMGVAAMTLQAAGGEGHIRLTWQQSDFDLLAGYNLYGADAADGTYSRLNQTVILAGDESFVDTNVVPAQPKFYKFTVVQTDLQESDFSNVASAAAWDTIPPVLQHVPVTSAPVARGLRLSATATDNVGVTNVAVYYRPMGDDSNYIALAMANISGNEWSGTIPSSAVQPPGLEYYVVATDGISMVSSGTAVAPHMVLVSDQPKVDAVTPNQAPAAGGTTVSVSGVRFQPGAQIFFGGTAASNVLVLSANQLTCTTPPHFPALVDVRLLNPDDSEHTLLNGFRYVTAGTTLSLPVVAADFGAELELPITAADVAGLRAASITVGFDPSVLGISSVRTGPLVTGWALSVNAGTAGRVVLSMAGATAAEGNGVLAFLKFSVIGHPPASTSLSFLSVSLNDGAIQVQTSPGLFTVNGYWSLSGAMRHFNGAPLTNVALSIVGVGTLTTVSGDAGGFGFTNLQTGSYTLRPSKNDEVQGISAYDASLVLQSEAGLTGLSPNQRVAADVNRNAMVTSMDAAYILEHAVGLIDLPFSGAGKIWDFLPAERSYIQINADLSGQDFTGILLGDVSGNWPATGQGSVAYGPGPGSPLAIDSGPILGIGSVNRVLLKANVPIYSIELVVAYSPTNPPPGVFQPGGLAQNLMIAANTNTPGVVRLALAGARAITGDGVLLTIPRGPSASNDMVVIRAIANEGAADILIEPTIAVFDTDGDGLVDVDERDLHLTDAEKADTDGDGATDLSEVLAGTDPWDPREVLRLLELNAADPDLRILTWSTVPGKKYQLEFKDRLQDAEWQMLGQPVQAVGAVTSVEDQTVAGNSQRFYRIRLTQ